MKILKRFTAFLLALMLLAAPAAASDAAADAPPEGYGIVAVILNFIDRYYHYDVNERELTEAVLKQYLTDHPEAFEDIIDSVMSVLDEHSVYFTNNEFNAFNDSIEAQFGGIGVYFTRYNGKATITSVIENSPAKKAGLIANDAIIAVNGESIVGADIDYVVSLIRGELGSTVTLTVEREGVSPFDVVVARDTLHEVTASGALINDNIGYISIVSFSSATAEEFKSELKRLKDLGADRYIVDLRNNGGGLTSAAIECAAQFLPEGAPVFIEDSKAYGKSAITVAKNGEYKNLAVLINEYSASASEIFATAIQSNNAGILVGTKTYGKGTVQTTAGLGSYGGIKLTIAEFLTPDEQPIDKVGITPDMYIKNMPRDVEADDLFPLMYNKKFQLGDNDEQIYALKHRLAILKYYGGDLDNYFDAGLETAVKNFQADHNLFPYGKLDFTTQTAINNMAMASQIIVDSQLDAAIDAVNTL